MAPVPIRRAGDADRAGTASGRWLRIAAACLAVLLPAAVTAVPSGVVLWSDAARDAGVSLSVQVRDPAGDPPASPQPVPAGRSLELRLALQDETAGLALRGVRPRAWLSRTTSDPPEPCTDQVRRFVGGRFVARADRDLNAWQVVTLNGDATLSVINPQVNVGATRLESLVTLPGPGAELVHLRGRDRLLVTIPSQGLLAVVDLGSFAVVQRIELGRGAPRRLVVTPDERRAFVALDDAGTLAVVDLDAGRRVAEVDIGDGLHGLALAADGRRVVATSTTAGRVTVVDTATATVVARHAVDGTPLAVTWSPLSRLAYVARANGSALAVVDPDTGVRRADIAFSDGVTALRADPSGRWLVGIDALRSRLHVVDAAQGRLLGGTGTVEQPDQVVFTARFAYVRGLSSLAVTLLDLAELARGELATTTVPMYQRRPDAAPGEIGVADMIVPSPDGAGVLVANGADTAMYAYMEGMQAPQGTYRTYSRAARGLLVVDRSLQEAAPGEFVGRFRLDRGGRYSLAVLVDQPRVVRCFDLVVDDTGVTPTGARIAMRHDAPAADALRAGRPVVLRIHLADADTDAPLSGLDDVQLMVLELPGLSQQRRFMREVAPGVYEAEQRFPRPGTWRAQVQIASRGVPFERSPTLDLDVRPDGRP